MTLDGRSTGFELLLRTLSLQELWILALPKQDAYIESVPRKDMEEPSGCHSKDGHFWMVLF